MTELAAPRVVRRAVAFAEAVHDRVAVVEGVEARLAADGAEARRLVDEGFVAVLVDPDGRQAASLAPRLLVDARMLKRAGASRLDEARLVVGLGPGFEAGVDCHFVVETQRGPVMGDLIAQGSALADTGVPGVIGGESARRLLRAPVAGRFEGLATIGELVEAGRVVGRVEGEPVVAAIAGRLRGLLRSGLIVAEKEKIGDVDPRGADVDPRRISDKARACGRAVVEAAKRAELR